MALSGTRHRRVVLLADSPVTSADRRHAAHPRRQLEPDVHPESGLALAQRHSQRRARRVLGPAGRRPRQGRNDDTDAAAVRRLRTSPTAWGADSRSPSGCSSTPIWSCMCTASPRASGSVCEQKLTTAGTGSAPRSARSSMSRGRSPPSSRLSWCVAARDHACRSELSGDTVIFTVASTWAAHEEGSPHAEPSLRGRPKGSLQVRRTRTDGQRGRHVRVSADLKEDSHERRGHHRRRFASVRPLRR